MLTLLLRREFSLLWMAHNISIVGDYVFFMAITFWIYQQTGSALATGLILIVSTIPGILFAPLTGMLVDRWKQQYILLVAESARALLFIALFFSLMVQPQLLWPIYVVGFAQSALATFFWSARSALLPRLLEANMLLTANALYTASDSAVRIIAPALAAFILLHLGPLGVAGINAITFVFSTGCTCLLIASSFHFKQAIQLPEKKSMVGKTLLKRQNISGLLALAFIIAYTAGTLSVIFPVFAQTILLVDPLVFSWLITAQAVGETIISLLLGRLPGKQDTVKIAIFLSGSLVCGGCMLILLIIFPTIASSLVCTFVFGMATAGVTVYIFTLLQQRTAQHFPGRALATYTAIQNLAQVSGLGIASLLTDHIGEVWFFVFNGGLYVLGGVLTWRVIRKG